METANVKVFASNRRPYCSKIVTHPLLPGDIHLRYRKLIEAIKRSRDWEAKFMLLEEMLKEERNEGRIEGQERVNRLYKFLADENRIDDLIRSTTDANYQELLFKEFGM